MLGINVKNREAKPRQSKQNQPPHVRKAEMKTDVLFSTICRLNSHSLMRGAAGSASRSEAARRHMAASRQRGKSSEGDEIAHEISVECDGEALSLIALMRIESDQTAAISEMGVELAISKPGGIKPLICQRQGN